MQPYLEYCVNFQSLHLKRTLQGWKIFQKENHKKREGELKQILYLENLKPLRIFTFEKQCLRVNVTGVYKL